MPTQILINCAENEGNSFTVSEYENGSGRNGIELEIDLQDQKEYRYIFLSNADAKELVKKIIELL